MTSLLERLRGRLTWFSGNLDENPIDTVAITTDTEPVERTQLALDESENTLLAGARRFGDTDYDRQPYDRQELMENCLEAWRFNPLARRIIELTTQYVIGGGMTVSADEASAEAFLQQFWRHPLNKMDLKLPELSDELARTGNLFLMLSGDLSGMSFARVVPSTDVLSIHSRANDVEQELSYTLRGARGEEDYVVPAWRADRPAMQQNAVCILHYAVNRPAGAQWGEPDLAPV